MKTRFVHNVLALLLIVVTLVGVGAPTASATEEIRYLGISSDYDEVEAFAPGDTVCIYSDDVYDLSWVFWYVKRPGEAKFREYSSYDLTLTLTAEDDGTQIYCKSYIYEDDEYEEYEEYTSGVLTLSLLYFESQPKDAYAPKGEYASTSVKVHGQGLSYTWQVVDPVKDTRTTSSITKSTYSVKMNDARNGCKVSCIVSDHRGAYIYSDYATLHMTEGIKITKQPKNASAISGSKASTTVKATGNGLKYRWYYKDTDDSKFTKTSDTDNTYSCEMTSSKSGRKVYCKITDRYGNTVKTNTVTLKLKKSTAKITSQPKNASGASGETVSTTVKATGDGLKYQWYYKDTDDSKYTKSSDKDATYSCKMTAAKSGRTVYCKITDKYGNTVKTKAVTLSRLSITQQPSGKTVSSYGKVSTTIKASGDGLKYRWYIKDSDETEYTKTSNTSKTYSFELSSASNGRSAYCVVTDKYGNSVKSDVVTFKYKAPSTSNSSTGSSNTGSSDSVLNKKECPDCRRGRCKKCGGDGEYETYMAGVKGSVTVTCKNCNNGSCRTCGGDGYK